MRDVVVSPNGAFVYAASATDNAVVAFAPEPEATWLAFVAAITVGFIRWKGARAC